MLWGIAIFMISFAVLLKMVNEGDERKHSLWKRKTDDDMQERILAEMRRELEAREQI